MAGAAQHARQGLAPLDGESPPHHRIAAVINSHRLIPHDFEAVSDKCPAPPGWMKQPELRQHIATFAVAAELEDLFGGWVDPLDVGK